MKIVLDIPDNKVDFMMELLRSLSFLKTKPMPVGSANEKELFLGEWNKAMEESNDGLANKTQASNT